MLVTKSYQDSQSLQAIPNITNTDNKVFLLIVQQAYKGKNLSIKLMMLILKVSRSTIVRATALLQKLGLIFKRRRHINAPVDYLVTEKGVYWHPYLLEAYKIFRAIFFSIGVSNPAQPSSEHPYSYNVFNKGVVKSLGVRELQTAPARDPKTTPILLTTARKEADVGSMEHKTMDLPEHVVSLTPLLQLTTHGQIKLSMFDKETVDYAWNTVKLASGCKDVFKELVDLCLQYCKDNELAVDWKGYYDALDSGLATKKDFCTKNRITSAMIKPRVVKDSRGSETQAALVLTEREKMRQRQLDWQTNQTAQDLERKLAIARLETASLIGVEVADPSFFEVEVVQAKPAEWSQTDKQLVDWALDYINKMSMGKQFYIHYEQEILLGPDSPRAKTGELQAGLKLMQRLYFQELANRVETTPITKVVTELKDQIVCAQIANDEKVWDNLTYSPVEGDEVFEEIYD